MSKNPQWVPKHIDHSNKNNILLVRKGLTQKYWHNINNKHSSEYISVAGSNHREITQKDILIWK